jgi:hypothetical protein
MGDLVLKIEPAEPAVGQVQLDFLTQLAFRANAIAVADAMSSSRSFASATSFGSARPGIGVQPVYRPNQNLLPGRCPPSHSLAASSSSASRRRAISSSASALSL